MQRDKQEKEKEKERRRRSFDGGLATHLGGHHQQQGTTTKPLVAPAPHSSVSARVTSSSTSPIPTIKPSRPTTPLGGTHVIGGRGGITVPKINTTSVPFPRGGRQIGASSVTTQPDLRRSSSIERGSSSNNNSRTMVNTTAVEGKVNY